MRVIMRSFAYPTTRLRLCATRLEAVSAGNFLGPRVEQITVNELFDDLLQDYKMHEQFFLWPERSWNAHLKDYFGGAKLPLEKNAVYGGMKASRVGTTQIAGYVEKRQSEGASRSTINRELALLRRAFSLAFDAEPQKASRVRKFHRFIASEKGNERRGFVEEPQYRKLAGLAKSRGSVRCLRSRTPTDSGRRNCLGCAARKSI